MHIRDYKYFVGPHQLRFEPPDVFHMSFRGTVEPAHVDEFFEWVHRLSPNGRIYLLRDARSGGMLGAKTRSRISEMAIPQKIAAIVSYGASFQLRVIVTMLVKTVGAFKKSAPEVAFADDEVKARAWISAHRAEKTPH